MSNGCVNDIQNSFFLINSENLQDVETELFGYVISDCEVIIDKNDVILDKLDGTGAYCYLLRENSKISIYQDFAGCYGLYLYHDEKTNFFAISNSFFKLVEYLKEKVPLTFDYDYANSFIPASLVSFAYKRTLVNEIKTIDKNLIVNIDIEEKSFSYTKIDYKEKTVDLESKEALVIMDTWFEKWVNIFNNVYSKTNNINLHLSGGFDSRVNLALVLSSQIDFNNINILSRIGEDSVKTEDLQIAKKIADYYGFKLNKGLDVGKNYFDNLDDSFNLSFYYKLGFCKLMYWKDFSYDSNVFTITGFGGGLIKQVYKKPAIDVLVRSHAIEANNYSPDLVKSSEIIVREAFDNYEEILKDEMDDNPNSIEKLFNLHYTSVRNRLWFGKNTAEAVLFNELQLNPLMDPMLNQIEVNVGKDFIMHCLIYSRYCPKLHDFEFQGDREISQDVKEYVDELNKILPYELDDSTNENISENRNQSVNNHISENEKACASNFRQILSEVFNSNYFKKSFLMYFPKEAYEKMQGSYKDVVTGIAIMKFMDDVHYSQHKFSDSIVNWYDSILDESKHVLVDKNITESKTPANSNMGLSKSLRNYITARLDIKNVGVEDNDVIIDSISDVVAKVTKPDWNATKEGHGTQIESYSGKLDIELTCVNDGNLRILLKSKNIVDKNKKRLPIYIDYRNFKVDSEVIFKENPVVSHDKFYSFKKDVKNNQKVKIHIEWKPFNDKSYFKE